MNIKIGLYALVAPIWFVSAVLQFQSGQLGTGLMFGVLGVGLLFMGISKDKTQK